jgi:hypothetical protein
MPLSAAHKAKISAGMKAYHAACKKKKCACPPTKKYITARQKPAKPRAYKRLRKTGAKKPPAKKATPPPAKKKAKRRVALTKVGGARKAKSKPFGGVGMGFTGLKTYHKALGGLESKYGAAVDMAPDLGF